MTAVEWTASTVDIDAGHRVHALPDVLDDPGATSLSGDELKTRQERVADAVGNSAPERTSPQERTGLVPVAVPRTGD